MNRNAFAGITSLLLFPVSACTVLLAVQPILSPFIFCLGAIGMFISMLLLTRLCHHATLFSWAIFLAIVVRILFVLYYPPCVDTYRYIWEGYIQLHGFNPFLTAPDSPETAHLRNAIWQEVIFRGTTTSYWPFAQMLFRAAAYFGQPQLAIKLIITFFDVSAIVLLMQMSRRRGHPLRYVLLYALNPLVVIFTNGQGHIEAVVATLLLAAIGLSGSRKFQGLAYSLLSCAILTKLYAAILLPFFIRQIGLRRIFFLALPLLLFIPYAADISEYIKVPMSFAGGSSHNGLIFTAAEFMFAASHQTALLFAAAFLTLCLALIFFLTPSLLQASSYAIGTMLLCLPIVHPWYFLLFTPYLVFFRQWSWLSLHITSVPLIFYFNPSVSPPEFHERSLLMTLEYLPFILLSLYALFRNHKHWPATYSSPETVSVIIPVRNEELRIGHCLDSLKAQDYPCEIIVVDGGSGDGTLPKLRQYPEVLVTSSAPGRGRQIAKGVAQSSGDIVLVLHADSRLKAGSLKKMVTALRARPEAAGGAMEATYDSPSLRFRLVALLNNLRAQYTGISFGDQAQFFRKKSLPEGFPDLLLMEDVELSLRLKAHGSLLFLPDGVWSSSRRWDSTGYTTNFFMVISFTGLYLFLRAFNRINDKGAWFYKRYYRKGQ